jgi:hypothetical protein
VQPLIAPFLWAKLLKRHKRNLGKARNQRSLAEGESKSGAEGVGLKLLKESGAIFLVHIRFVLILSS